MIVRFVKLSGGDLAYLEKKWSLANIFDVTAYELALEGLKTSQSDPLPMEEPKGVAYDQSHLDHVSAKADLVMPYIEGESLVSDSFKVLTEHAASFSKGTVLLHRITTHAEYVFFMPCMRLVDGTIYIIKPQDENEMDLISTMGVVVLERDTQGPENSDGICPPPASNEAFTIGAIASTIALGIISGAASQIGSKAVSWAFKELGIDDIMQTSELSYDQLVDALKLQSRKDFRQTISAKMKSFSRLIDDYNHHFDLATLDDLYREIRDIVSYLEEDYAEVDRVEFLAFAQTQYLAIMQERAEQWRDSDPDKLKDEYGAIVNRAKKEADVLKKIKQTATDNRLKHITGLHYRPDVTSIIDYNVAYFEDIEKADETMWLRYQVTCAKRSYVGHYCQCDEYEITDKGEASIETLQGRMNRHKNKIKNKIKDTLKNVNDCIHNFEKIAAMTVPPDPPK